MLYSMETYRQDASVMMNGLTVGGVLIDVLRMPAITNGFKDYPNTQVGNLQLVYIQGTDSHVVTTSSTGLAARITWQYKIDAVQSDSVIYVFNKKTIGIDYGIQVLNDADQILADHNYPSPQFAGKAIPNTQAIESYNTPDGYVAHVHSYGSINKRPGADQLIVMAMPEVAGNDTWYHMRRNHILAEEGNVPVEIVVFTKASSYQVPTLHFFAVNNAQSTGDVYGFRLFNATFQVTFDASYENMGNLLDINPVMQTTQTNTITIPSLTLPGLIVPHYKLFEHVGANKRTWLGVGKKVGTQFTTKAILDRENPWQANDAAYSFGRSTGYSPVVKLDAQSPLVYTGTPGVIQSKPYFTAQPISKAVRSNESATFSVTVAGKAPITLQWTSNGIDIAGATSSSITRYGGTQSFSEQLQCRASNDLGTTLSEQVVFVVTEVINADITAANGPVEAYVGDTVTFSMTATGDPIPYCTITGQGGLFASGYGSASVTTTATLAMSGSVQWKADNEDENYGAIDTTNRTFNVMNPPDNTPAPVFSTTPGNKEVTQGQSAIFYAVASDTSNYAWYRGNTYVGSGTSFSADTSQVGFFSHRVVANGPGGSAESSFTLIVNPPAEPTPKPVFSTNPTSFSTPQNGSGSFYANASNASSYTWYRDGVNQGTGQTHYPTTSVVGTFEYQCKANGPGGDEWSSPAMLTVTPPAATTFDSYNTIDGDVYGDETSAGWGIYGNGSTDTIPWANGNGNGDNYAVFASADFTPDSGSSPLNQWIVLSGGQSWTCPALPAKPNNLPYNETYTLNVSVALLNNGGGVTSGSITFNMSHPGNL